MHKMIFPIITEEEVKLPFYVTSIGSNDNQYHVQRPDGYPGYHFLYCTTGKGRLLIDGTEYPISENMGFFFQPGIPHEYYAEEEPWMTWWITFDGYAVNEMLSVAGLGRYNVFYVYDMEKLHHLQGDVHTAAGQPRPAGSYDASHMLYKLLLELKNCTGAEALNTRHGRSRQLQPLLMYIENSYNGTISLDDMANISGVTPQHLCRLFRKTYNIRPFEYLTRFRLQKAKEILVGPGNPVLKEVAARTGFNDTSYFCSVFKHYEGMTPVEFKRMHMEY